MDVVNKIRDNNSQINVLISNIIEKMSENGINAIAYNENNEPYINQPAKKILEMQMKNCFAIYSAEFIYLMSSNKEKLLEQTEITACDEEGADAYGFLGEISFSAGTSAFFSNLSIGDIKYQIDNNGKIIYGTDGEDLKKIDVNLIGKKGKPHLLEESEIVENSLSMYDYLYYAVMKDMKDLDFFLDVLPHEAMHVFGFNGGIFEGVTENFTRQIAQKYNIRSTCVAHSDETRLIQKVEKVIGRRKLATQAFDEEKEKKIDTTSISEALDEVLYSDKEEGKLFEKYCQFENEFFNTIKQDDYDLELSESLYKNMQNAKEALESELDKYIIENPEKLYLLGDDNTELSSEERAYQNIQFEKVISIQKEEIETLTQILQVFEQTRNIQKIGSKHNLSDQNDYVL